jgi:hypothetical protein
MAISKSLSKRVAVRRQTCPGGGQPRPRHAGSHRGSARFAALLFVVLAGLIPFDQHAAAHSASISLTLEIEPAPLVARVDSNCVFVVNGPATLSCGIVLLVGQPTHTDAGWRVSLATTGVVDTDSGKALPADALSLAGVEPVVFDQGQAIDLVGGPSYTSSGTGQTLDTPRPVLVAEPGFGNGVYSETIRLVLTVPEGAAPGNYVPEWSIDIASGEV